MPEHETANWPKIPYPDELGEAKVGATDMQEIAVRVDKILYEKVLTIVKHAGAYEAKSGELGVQEKAGETTTLPSAATKDQVIGVWCKASSCKITTTGGAFVQGDFITIASKTATVTLLEAQHVVLQSDGTNWLIVVGEPKREAKYSVRVEREAETEYEPSPTRPTFVIVQHEIAAETEYDYTIVVGGVVIQEIKGKTGAKTQTMGESFRCPAGQKWKVNGIKTGILKSSYLEE